MIFMPITGIAMGIFSGYGVPFFFTNIPGVKNPNKEISNNAYYSHKKVGKVFEGLVAIHIIATAYYYFNGIPTIPRISPFDEDDDDK